MKSWRTATMLSGLAILAGIGGGFGAVLLSSPAQGFSAPHMFREHLLLPPTDGEAEGGGSNDPGGGADRWFTGSPRDRYDCSVCHRGAGEFPVEITGLPERGYTPGQTYNLEISWPSEVVRAAILGEFVDAEGNTQGEIVEVSTRFAGEDISSATIESSRDQSRQLFSLTADFLDKQVQQGLQVRWTAPQAAEPQKARPLWLYVVGVHPDAETDAAGGLDTTDDATFSRAIDLPPDPAADSAKDSANGSANDSASTMACSLLDGRFHASPLTPWFLIIVGAGVYRRRCVSHATSS